MRAPAQATGRFPALDRTNAPAVEIRQFPERKVKQAMAFLREVFADGQAHQASKIATAAEARDFRPSTIQTAKTRLHISSQRSGTQWVWVPPKPRQPRKKPSAPGI